MKVIEKIDGYMIELEATETIEIKINGNSVYNHSIGSDKKAQINFNLQETIIVELEED